MVRQQQESPIPVTVNPIKKNGPLSVCDLFLFVTLVAFLLFWVSSLISNIVIGVIHVNDCRDRPEMPIFLIIIGILGLSMLPTCFFMQNKVSEKIFQVIGTIVFLSFKLVAIRMYWLHFQGGSCNHTLYLYTFWYCTVVLSLLALLVVFSIIYCKRFILIYGYLSNPNSKV